MQLPNLCELSEWPREVLRFGSGFCFLSQVLCARAGKLGLGKLKVLLAERHEYRWCRGLKKCDVCGNFYCSPNTLMLVSRECIPSRARESNREFCSHHGCRFISSCRLATWPQVSVNHADSNWSSFSCTQPKYILDFIRYAGRSLLRPCKLQFHQSESVAQITAQKHVYSSPGSSKVQAVMLSAAADI